MYIARWKLRWKIDKYIMKICKNRPTTAAIMELDNIDCCCASINSPWISTEQHNNYIPYHITTIYGYIWQSDYLPYNITFANILDQQCCIHIFKQTQIPKIAYRNRLTNEFSVHQLIKGYKSTAHHTFYRAICMYMYPLPPMVP
jgi:hypothetical protein